MLFVGPQPDDTPARFTKLMDAAGLAQDLSNPFDASFRKAGENPPHMNLIDAEPPAGSIIPPTTAEVLQQVVEQEQPLWKNEAGELRAPVITTRLSSSFRTSHRRGSPEPPIIPDSGNSSLFQLGPDFSRTSTHHLLHELPENGSRGSSNAVSSLEPVTIKNSDSPPPSSHNPVSLLGLNPVAIVGHPMIGMLHGNSNLNLNRHFPPHFSSTPIGTTHDSRGTLVGWLVNRLID